MTQTTTTTTTKRDRMQIRRGEARNKNGQKKKEEFFQVDFFHNIVLEKVKEKEEIISEKYL